MSRLLPKRLAARLRCALRTFELYSSLGTPACCARIPRTLNYLRILS